MPNLFWKYNNIVVNTPIDMGAYEYLEESQEFLIDISHDGTSPIMDCELYLSPFSKEYKGTESAIKDYERLLWYGNSYPDYGFGIAQSYEVDGIIDSHNGTSIIDFDRFETRDIFAGSEIEILSGQSIGEKVIIESYDLLSRSFTMSGDFSSNVAGANYKIKIEKEDYVRTRFGSSRENGIPLVYKGGMIERLDSAQVRVKLKVPRYAMNPGNFQFDFNMKFTSIED